MAAIRSPRLDLGSALRTGLTLGMVYALSAIPVAATDSAGVGGCAGVPQGTVLDATSGNYLGLLSGLGPGDTLRLAAGTYTGGLPISGLTGNPNDCIFIEGPEQWPPTARFVATNSNNTINIIDSRYLVVRYLELDGTGDTVSADGVKLSGDASFGDHITLENLYIHDHDFGQGTVGISTKAPAWSWVIRNNVIEECGTGLYLGNSTGGEEFVGGLIEHNLIRDTIGYNMQIKHQNGRNTGIGIPADAQTIIRHNVFSKVNNSSTGGDSRPNLLVGHWPLSGPGANDDYLIYGNFFFQNATAIEPLFQGEGNVIFYDNLLVNDFGDGARFQAHNDVPRRIRAFQNTVVAAGVGLHVSSGHASYSQELTGNASFAGSPLTGGTQTDNTVDTEANAGSYLVSPFDAPGAGLDLYPMVGGGLDLSVDTGGLSFWEDWNLDFNGNPRSTDFRGAYAGSGTNPGWTLALERKPEVSDTAIFGDGFESGSTTGWSTTSP